MSSFSRYGWFSSGAIVALLLVSLSGAGAASPRRFALTIDRVEEDCLQIPPDETPPLALNTKEPLDLQVRVMFERGDRSVVKEHMESTDLSFERIGIDLDVSYDGLRVPQEWKRRVDTSSGGRGDLHFELMKDRYGGERPKGIDVVYFFSRYWAGGMADCIGGVRFPDRAFAFGSVDYSIEGIVPAPTVNEGVIASHEIGHLLGAHHHYSNCVEAPARGALAGQAAACTTMSPSATVASAFFGVIEASFLRHYTKEYAQD